MKLDMKQSNNLKDSIKSKKLSLSSAGSLKSRQQRLNIRQTKLELRKIKHELLD